MLSGDKDKLTSVDAKKIRTMIKRRASVGDIVNIGGVYGIYCGLNAQRPLMKEGKIIVECYPLPSEADTSVYVKLGPEITYKGRRIQLSMSLKSVTYQGLLPFGKR